ncbi:hypothetical protein Desku_0771 [Desulfofundulus kuznetsovii DSM 6115]|uniref:Uncharacterized protein n=1 Tax=Desulfofundulus kuznetsovii (strain DSM 6115 / VKM B-1805 / 17) TaxID=760568 RepID=A0AAU8PF68_DESK7|nr:hypothetical protein Desku_0771 [Desulfofundulus kuznetsovii DSM 6115]
MQKLLRDLALEILKELDSTKRIIVIESDKDLEIYQAKKEESTYPELLSLKQGK